MWGKVVLIVSILGALSSSGAFGKEPTPPESLPWLEVKFGPEFTFLGEGDNGEAKNKIIARQKSHLLDRQPVGAKFDYNGSDTFTSPNGWWFKTNTDPKVVEVQMKPMTVSEFTRFQGDIQDAVFVSAANEGWFPALFQGGGHINIGVNEIIEYSPLLMRNFLADLINHSELFFGIFNYDTNNALPYPLLPLETRKQIINLFASFDRNQISITELMRSMRNLQWALMDPFAVFWSHQRMKYTALSFENVLTAGGGHFELRGIRPQASMDVWVRQIRLINKRIHYLMRIKKPLAVEPIIHLAQPIVVTPEAHVLNPPVDPQKALGTFHRYLIESGERWEDHKDYLWPAWITNGEVAKYEASTTFRTQQLQTCANELMTPAN
jgi:hypothetical protein